jgi:hypothetical protein
MFDEMIRLRESPPLQQLLAHYVQLGRDDREAWHDRVMEMEGVASMLLTRLHGELIAFGWIEQNTGVVPLVRANAVPGCYRATGAGHRALRQAAVTDLDQIEADADARAA